MSLVKVLTIVQNPFSIVPVNRFDMDS
jgi:hypothetical protein